MQKGPQRPLAGGDSARIREFLELNRLRFAGSRMTDAQRERWEALRWEIEASLSGLEASEHRRRQALRVPVDLPVDVSDTEPSGSETSSRASEIAECGLFLATEHPPAVGTRLRLRLHDESGGVSEVEGAVVWVRERAGSDGPAGVGIEFGKLDAAQREALAYLVEVALAAL